MLIAPALALIAAVGCTVLAQQPPPRVVGYGTAPCTVFDANNVPRPNQLECASSTCVLEPETGFYFCGIKNAACGFGLACDFGRCQDGICTGGFGDPAEDDVNNCLGSLYIGDDGNCGTAGAQCIGGDDYACSSMLCGAGDRCRPAVQPGDACLVGETLPCGPNLYASLDIGTGACTCLASSPPTASQRARGRRRSTVSLCPASFSACPVGKGYECVDTQSNLERCGGCSDETGAADCTALPGVEAVGCVDGQCEIWACAAGYSFDAEAAECRKQ